MANIYIGGGVELIHLTFIVFRFNFVHFCRFQVDVTSKEQAHQFDTSSQENVRKKYNQHRRKAIAFFRLRDFFNDIMLGEQKHEHSTLWNCFKWVKFGSCYFTGRLSVGMRSLYGNSTLDDNYKVSEKLEILR
jgi:hypothetical protein